MPRLLTIIIALIISTATYGQQKDPSIALAIEKATNGHAYVDLGLSVMWATTNVGATSPSDPGKYYAWGEVKAKNDYSIFNYIYFRQTQNEAIGGVYLGPKYKRGYIKYVSEVQVEKDGYDGFFDNKRKLELTDDAAHANWGGGWRIPSVGEMNELCTRCRWEWTTANGKPAYKVTGPNGNFIIMPAAGARFRMKNCYVGDDGFYWTANIYSKKKNNGAYVLHFTRHGVGITENETRFDGRSVRPVIKFKKAPL